MGKELSEMGAHRDEEFRDLVQQLMNAGWYRVGQKECSSGPSWQFRQGHILEADAEDVRWISAPDEVAAMRTLWNSVCNERVAEDS